MERGELIERLRLEASRKGLTYGIAPEHTLEGQAADALEEGGMGSSSAAEDLSPAATRSEAQHSAGWRDIASAPRDGTWVLALGDRFGTSSSPPIGVTRWVVAEVEDWEATDRNTKRRIFRDDSHWDYEADVFAPTHWMPLPPAPETPTSQDDRRECAGRGDAPGINKPSFPKGK